MSAGQLPPPGTVLRKIDRNGVVRCAAVVADGGKVVYRGVTYSSISAAAKVAAGDIGLAARSCDGYAFFCLKGRDASSHVPTSRVPTLPLRLPFPMRWEDMPSAAPVDHSEHGRADESGAPRDPDCSCRGGSDEVACAVAGCGFCRAARMVPVALPAPVVAPVPAPVGLVEQFADDLDCTPRDVLDYAVDSIRASVAAAALEIIPNSAITLANIDPRLAVATVAAERDAALEARGVADRGAAPATASSERDLTDEEIDECIRAAGETEGTDSSFPIAPQDRAVAREALADTSMQRWNSLSSLTLRAKAAEILARGVAEPDAATGSVQVPATAATAQAAYDATRTFAEWVAEIDEVTVDEASKAINTIVKQRDEALRDLREIAAERDELRAKIDRERLENENLLNSICGLLPMKSDEDENVFDGIDRLIQQRDEAIAERDGLATRLAVAETLPSLVQAFAEAKAGVRSSEVTVEYKAQEAIIDLVEWCTTNRVAGRAPCGACAWCCKQATERAERAEALAEIVRGAAEAFWGALGSTFWATGKVIK